MKRNLLRYLMLGGALLLSLTNSNAWAGYVIQMDSSPKYFRGGWGKNSEYAKQFAVSNGVIYSSVPSEDHFVYYNPTTNVGTTLNETTGDYTTNPTTAAGNADAIGRAVVTDDAGNIIYAAGCGYNSKVTWINVLPKTENRGEIIDPAALRSAYKHKGYDIGSGYTTILNTFEGQKYGRTDYYHASGNLIEGNGALWFTDGFSVVKVPIVDGAVQSEVVYDIPDNASHTDTYNQWWYQSQFRPYADGKYLLQNANGLFDCTISSSGVMTCTQIEGASAYVGATIGYLKDHEILVYCKNNRDGYITVYDRTAGIEISTFKAFDFADDNTAPAFHANVNVWCEVEVIDENTLAIYTNIPGYGVSRFLLISTTDTTALTATIAQRAGTNYQDVSLSWAEPYLASSVTLQYRKRYIKDGETRYTGWTSLAEKTTEQSYTHSNVYWYTDDDGFYKTTVEYRLIYHYDTMTSKDRLLTLTAEVEPQLIPKSIAWDLQEIVEYPGYQKVQLFWNTSGTGSTPKYYNVYRDGVKINSRPIQVFNYIDDKIPTGDHTYYVEAFVSNEIETLKTSEKSIYVNPRDPMKTTYSIEEIYNYRIGTGTNEVAPYGTYANLTSEVRYKQGVYYRGNWYVAKQNYGTDTNGDNEVTKDDQIYGGVIRFSADKQKILTERGTPAFTQYEVQSSWAGGIYSVGFSVGLAMDEGGNIFVRESGEYPKGTTKTSIVFSLGKGRIYLRNSDGTYNDNYLTVDLTGCNLHDNTGSRNADYIYYGRVDYYCMTGDLSYDGGVAYLYVSSHLGLRSNRIKLTRSGNNITAEDDYVNITIASANGTAFSDGSVESYAFPVRYLAKGATDANNVTSFSDVVDMSRYVHNSRSNGYFVVNPNTDAQGIIYETNSRKQNAGGCTIGFNDELFIITPQSVHSQNTGHFIVSMGDRTQYDANGSAVQDANGRDVMQDAQYADLSKIIPVAQYTQTDISDGSYSDANGNWLYAVHGTIEGENEIYEGLTNENHDCLYIYQYVPGVRFAKYRLIPNNYFPPTPVDITLSTRYEYATDEDGNIIYEETGETDENGNPVLTPVVNDITGFDGVVKWQKPDYESVGGGNVNYEHYSYTLVVTDKNGNVIDTREVPVDAAIENENGYYTIEYPFDNSNGGTVQTYNGNDVIFMPDENEQPQPYYAYITVNYQKISDPTEKRQSEQTVDMDKAGYVGTGATGNVTVVPSNPINAGTDGQGNKYVANLTRVDINIDEPDFNQAGLEEEPVSHYEIWVDKDGDGVYEYQLPGFNLMQGEEGVYTEVHDGKIPGDYDFDNNEAYALTGGKAEAESQANAGATVVPTPTTIFFNVSGTPYIEGTQAPTDDENPADWKYQVVTVYASTTEGVENRDISQSYTNDMSTVTASVVTGIEDVMTGDILKVYPIPVKSTLTIESPEALKVVKIHNIAGVVVKEELFNGESTATIDVDALAAGYYFVTVNNQVPVKIIKQ